MAVENAAVRRRRSEKGPISEDEVIWQIKLGQSNDSSDFVAVTCEPARN